MFEDKYVQEQYDRWISAGRIEDDILSDNIKLFESFMKAAIEVFHGDTNRIRIYGLFPAVGSIHSFDEPVLYNSKSKVLYQRKHGYRYDIDVDNDFIDMENDDA